MSFGVCVCNWKRKLHTWTQYWVEISTKVGIAFFKFRTPFVPFWVHSNPQISIFFFHLHPILFITTIKLVTLHGFLSSIINKQDFVKKIFFFFSFSRSLLLSHRTALNTVRAGGRNWAPHRRDSKRRNWQQSMKMKSSSDDEHDEEKGKLLEKSKERGSRNGRVVVKVHNQALLSGLAYCLSSCGMILVNKFVLSSYDFNAGISLMVYQVI